MLVRGICMRRNLFFCVLISVFSLAVPQEAGAQDPNSQHYRDTVVLPALGMGDTISGDRSTARDQGGGWGALAISQPFDIFGISLEQHDEVSAQRQAVQICEARGGQRCAGRLTFRNTCFALASGGGHWGGAARSRQRSADRVALQNCREFGGGSECAVIERTCR